MDEIIYKIGVVFALLVFPVSLIYAQGTKTEINNEGVVELVSYEMIAKEGTFVFEKTKKIEEIFTKERFTEILSIVAQNRDQSIERKINISAFTDLVIPPFDVINKPDFVPYPALFRQ